MDEKTIHNNDEVEIDLKRLLDALLDKAWLIAIISLLMAVITFAGTLLFITPQYKSAAMFYVNNTDLSVGNTK